MQDPQAPDKLIALHPWHLHVGHQRIKSAKLLRHLKGMLAVRCHCDLVTPCLKLIAHGKRNESLILGNKNPELSSCHSCRRMVSRYVL
jgi:hypothetical protein